MSKEEKTRVEIREEIEYICSQVRHGGNVVGFAPRIRFNKGVTAEDASDALDAMLEKLGPENVFSLADRQLDQDCKNKVRGKFTKDKVKASTIVNALAEGKLTSIEINDYAKAKGIPFTEAGAALLGVGKDAEIEPDKIHWDIL